MSDNPYMLNATPNSQDATCPPVLTKALQIFATCNAQPTPPSNKNATIPSQALCTQPTPPSKYSQLANTINVTDLFWYDTSSSSNGYNVGAVAKETAIAAAAAEKVTTVVAVVKTR